MEGNPSPAKKPSTMVAVSDSDHGANNVGGREAVVVGRCLRS
jgi:hypothetical protein